MLPLREDQLDRERYLFYVCASRAERLLVLSSRTSDEEGTPEAPSFFLDDVSDLLAGEPELPRALARRGHLDARRRAHRGRVGPRARRARPEAPGAAPGHAHRGAAPRAASRSGGALSASWLERFADCPVKWLVESVLRPEALEPDPEQMVRGQLAHDVLEHTFRRAARGDRRARA